jgi:hypothetical protein
MGIDDSKQKVEKGILPIKYPNSNSTYLRQKWGFPDVFSV